MPGIQDSGRLRELRSGYPMLSDPDLLRGLLDTGRLVHLKAGSSICELGQRCTHLALVQRGLARVFELAESGREITLYRVGTGECCILTASCIMSGQTFPAIARCEEDLEALLIPADRVEAFMLDFPEWRRFIWKLLADRMAGVLMLLEEVTFRRLDERVMRYLLRCREERESDDLEITHQTIADDLGSAREVVSRILKDMEQRQILALFRGRVVIRDHSRLARTLKLTDE